MTLEYSNTVEDAVAFLQHFQRTSPALRRRLWIAGLAMALLVFFVSYLAFGAVAGRAVVGAPAISALLFLAIYFPLVRIAATSNLRALFKDGRSGNPVGWHRLTASSDGLAEEYEGGAIVTKWHRIARVDRTDQHVFVYLTASRAHLVPVRAFASPAACDAFVEAAQEQIALHRRPHHRHQARGAASLH